MYPTIQSYDSTGAAIFQPPANAAGPLGPPVFGRPPPGGGSAAAANGPASSSGALPSPSAATPSSFPTLRVHIAEPYRTAPPVRAAPAALPPAKPASALILDYEHKVLDDLAAAGSGEQRAAEQEARPDPFEVLVKRYTDMGYSREEVGMALAVAGEDTGDTEKVVECCKQYRELRSMGFKADIVVGALVLSRGDLNAATDACLTANMD